MPGDAQLPTAQEITRVHTLSLARTLGILGLGLGILAGAGSGLVHLTQAVAGEEGLLEGSATALGGALGFLFCLSFSFPLAFALLGLICGPILNLGFRVFGGLRVEMRPHQPLGEEDLLD